MSLNCDQCGASDFRSSHFRGSDVAQLLHFQFPVRCRVCRARSHVFLTKFLLLRCTRIVGAMERHSHSGT